jgi:glutamate synthase domain-containing protein 2
MAWITSRYFTFGLALFVFIAGLVLWGTHGAWPWATVFCGALSAVGLWDVLQTRHAIRRNYPILAHFRFLFEKVRPELRQYLFESDTEAAPFSRNQRAIVYQRAKQDTDKRPFGTQLDVYATGYEWINHATIPVRVDPKALRTRIGGPHCTQPYDASVFNISAMSFGALSANAIRALNQGAQLGGFYHDTGEGSISVHHRACGGDLVWEIGSGYFGCRNDDGSFNLEKFAAQANTPQVKMIELKLSQGAKPGHGGVLPAAKVTPEIADARGVALGQDCVSPASHSAFATPIEMMHFVATLRAHAHGKPVGFKFCVGHPWEWFAMAKAMLATGIAPDFIVVDGSEGGTGAAPVEFTDHVGLPLTEGLLLVHNTLVGIGLRDQVKVGAAGKIVTAFDIARTIALGADWCNSARGFMFALGCIQAQSCHTGKCPTGVTTQDPMRQRALVIPDKSQRVAHFHSNTLKALAELLAATGVTHPDQLTPEHVIRRVSPTEVKSLARVYPRISSGELLGNVPESAVFQAYWSRARAESFSLSA